MNELTSVNAPDLFVARQPIFTERMKVHGYELLFRSGAENVFPNIDGNVATADLIGNVIGTFGLDALTGGKLAFVNFTRNMLVGEYYRLLPPERMVIELLEDVEPDEEVIEASKRLKDAGYTLALDDVVRFDDDYAPLFDLADIIKVDWLNATIEDRRKLAARANSTTKLLAEKVETPAELDEAVELGYDFFQGYFLSKPAMISGKRVTTFKPHLLKLLQAVSRPDFDFKEIESIIKQDVALSYRMLRFANSAASGLAQKVTSLGHALVMLGQHEVARAASLLVLADLGGDKPQELTVSSLARASFMESLAGCTSVAVESVDVFLTGLCSRLDAMLDLPMTEVVGRLPLSGPVSSALLGEKGELRTMLDLAVAYDAAQWDRVSVLAATLGVPDLELAACYLRATEYSDRVFGNIAPENS